MTAAPGDKSRSGSAQRATQVGGELTFRICPACGASGSEAAIDCLKPNIRRRIDLGLPLVAPEVAG